MCRIEACLEDVEADWPLYAIRPTIAVPSCLTLLACVIELLAVSVLISGCKIVNIQRLKRVDWVVYVELETEDDVKMALKRNMHYLGSRYVTGGFYLQYTISVFVIHVFL